MKRQDIRADTPWNILTLTLRSESGAISSQALQFPQMSRGLGLTVPVLPLFEQLGGNRIPWLAVEGVAVRLLAPCCTKLLTTNTLCLCDEGRLRTLERGEKWFFSPWSSQRAFTWKSRIWL